MRDKEIELHNIRLALAKQRRGALSLCHANS